MIPKLNTGSGVASRGACTGVHKTPPRCTEPPFLAGETGSGRGGGI